MQIGKKLEEYGYMDQVVKVKLQQLQKQLKEWVTILFTLNHKISGLMVIKDKK